MWGKDKPWLEKHVRTVRSLLAGALGPLFMTNMQALNPELESDYIVDALDVLQRFIIGDNQFQGYTFSHPKLGQFFWESLTPSEQTQVEGRFLGWCSETFQEFIAGKHDPKKKAEVPAYAVRNYGAHLTRAQRPIEDWLPLIHHQAWAQAWFSVEGAYGGYLQDVNRVWEQCKLLDRRAVEATSKASYLGKQIRCGLIEASLQSLTLKIPPELIGPLVRDRVWSLSQVWATIYQMPSEYQQSKAVIGLIPYLEDEQLFEVLLIVQKIKEEQYRILILCELAHYMPEAIGEAFSVVWELKHRGDYIFRLCDLAEFLPKKELMQILAVARGIERREDCIYLLCNLAKRLPKEELWQVLAVAQEIENEGYLTQILNALTQGEPEKVGDALALVYKIQNEWDQANMLLLLAQHLPEEDFDQVLSTAQNSTEHVYILTRIGKMPAKRKTETITNRRIENNR
ncbi:MAG: hypothetical protein QM706_17990 [Nitrospira sp.]